MAHDVFFIKVKFEKKYLVFLVILGKDRVRFKLPDILWRMIRCATNPTV